MFSWWMFLHFHWELAVYHDPHCAALAEESGPMQVASFNCFVWVIDSDPYSNLHKVWMYIV